MNVKIYAEWLKLPKKAFELLIRLRLCNNTFSGSKADMCKWTGVSPKSHKNKETIMAAIVILKDLGYISYKHEENTYNHSLNLIELETDSVEYSTDNIKLIMQGGFSVVVADIPVIKTLIALILLDGDVFTQKEVGEWLNCAPSTVGNALKVLLNDFEAISRKYKYLVDEEAIQRIGTIAEVSAFFNPKT